MAQAIVSILLLVTSITGVFLSCKFDERLPRNIVATSVTIIFAVAITFGFVANWISLPGLLNLVISAFEVVQGI